MRWITRAHLPSDWWIANEKETVDFQTYTSDCKASFTPAVITVYAHVCGWAWQLLFQWPETAKENKRGKKKINGLQNAPEYFEGQTDLQVWCSFPPLRHITFDKKAAGCKIRHIIFLNSSSCGAQEFRMEVMSAPTAAADLGWMGSNLDERAALGSSWPPPRWTPEDACIKSSYAAIYQHPRRRAL